jgi:cytochrome c'
MRTIHWLFLVSVLLFISGIGFVVAGARAEQRAAPAEAPAPAIATVATVKQLMGGIVQPSATVVFESVGTIVDATGIHEQQPRTDAEWAAVGASAASLVEAANLLLVGNRAIDQGEWVKKSQAMADAAMLVVKATEAKDPQAVLAAGEPLNASCDACHEQYQRE